MTLMLPELGSDLGSLLDHSWADTPDPGPVAGCFCDATPRMCGKKGAPLGSRGERKEDREESSTYR